MIDRVRLIHAVQLDDDLDAINGIMASWRATVATDTDYAAAPEYLKVALAAYAFYMAAKTSGFTSLLSDDSCGHRLGEIFRCMKLIAAKDEIAWLENMLRQLPNGFPKTVSEARELSSYISELELKRGDGNRELYDLVMKFDRYDWQTLRLAKLWTRRNFEMILGERRALCVERWRLYIVLAQRRARMFKG